MDGCFDMMHYGHANALRQVTWGSGMTNTNLGRIRAAGSTLQQLHVLQAKAAGEELVVGLIPDSEILRCKGPPVLNDEERLALVECVKWVDEVLQGAGQEAWRWVDGVLCSMTHRC